MNSLFKYLVVLGCSLLWTSLYVVYVEIKHNPDACFLNLSRVSQAIGDYKQDKGYLPGRLEELVPTYLTEIPDCDSASPARSLRYAVDSQRTMCGLYCIHGRLRKKIIGCIQIAHTSHEVTVWR